MKKIAAVVALAVGAVAAGGAGAHTHAGLVKCTGLFNGTADNLVVPKNATCTLMGATVNGNIQILRGGALSTGAHAQFGSLQAVNPRWMQIEDASVGGSIQITGTSSTPGLGLMNTICRTFVGGAVQLLSNLGTFAVGDDVGCGPTNPIGFNGGNIVDGNVHFVGNKVTMFVSNNVIGANLQCVGKVAGISPIFGMDNAITGVNTCPNVF